MRDTHHFVAAADIRWMLRCSRRAAGPGRTALSRLGLDPRPRLGDGRAVPRARGAAAAGRHEIAAVLRDAGIAHEGQHLGTSSCTPS